MKKNIYLLIFILFAIIGCQRHEVIKTHGISYLDKTTNLIIYGGPDDIWYDRESEELIVVDYKAQSKKIVIEKQQYLNDPFHQGYKLQMDTYVHILRKMGFKTANKSYFLVCNAEKTYEAFNAKLLFETKLIDYDAKTDWIDESIKDMKKILDAQIEKLYQ